jgi:hypothetical protein
LKPFGSTTFQEEKRGHLFEGQVLSSNDRTEPTLPALVLQKDAASQTTLHHLLSTFIGALVHLHFCIQLT